MCGSDSAGQDTAVPAEAEHGEGDESVGGGEAEGDSGDESDLLIDGLDPHPPGHPYAQQLGLERSSRSGAAHGGQGRRREQGLTVRALHLAEVEAA